MANVISQLKGYITPYLPPDKNLREALLNLLNEIDSDLEVTGYEQSEEVDEKFTELDAAIAEAGNIEVEEDSDDDLSEDIDDDLEEEEDSDDDNDDEEDDDEEDGDIFSDNKEDDD